jgi:hypothetical protein
MDLGIFQSSFGLEKAANLKNPSKMLKNGGFCAPNELTDGQNDPADSPNELASTPNELADGQNDLEA